MALASSLSNIKITNNTIDINVLSGGSYTYTSAMSLGGSAIVRGNTFSGCIGTSTGSTNLISITAGSSRINDNTFIRGVGSPLNAYINVSSMNDQVVTENVFDSNTADGSNEKLVTGLTTRSLYERNKNQIAYKTISWIDYSMTADPALTGSTVTFGQSAQVNVDYATAPSPPSSYTPNLHWTVTSSFAGNKTLVVPINIGSVLPNGVKILALKMGFQMTGPATLSGSTNNRIILTCGTRDAFDNYAAGTNSIMDINNNALSINNVESNYSGGLPTGMQYLTLDVSALSAYETLNRTYHAMLQIYSNITAGGIEMYCSPVQIRYMW